MEMRDPGESKFNEESSQMHLFRRAGGVVRRDSACISACSPVSSIERFMPLSRGPLLSPTPCSEKMRFDKKHFKNAEKAVRATAAPGDTSPGARMVHAWLAMHLWHVENQQPAAPAHTHARTLPEHAPFPAEGAITEHSTDTAPGETLSMDITPLEPFSLAGPKGGAEPATQARAGTAA